jgi:dTDP-glucose 4,6-dehydratase
MRIFITGGTGFFGRALLRYWTEGDNHNYPEVACILTRNPQKFLVEYPEFNNISWLSFHSGDICYPQTFPKNDRYTHILHAATDSTVGLQLSPLERYHQIAEGTKNLLEYASMNEIKRFLLTSSGGIYGPQPDDMEKIPETYSGELSTLNAQNAYSMGKRTAEHLCALYRDRYGIDFVIARCFAFVGYDLPMDAHFAIGNFIRDAFREESITVNGDGSPIRSYMDQLDLAIWLSKLLEYGEPGEVYNVGSDIPISIYDLAYLVRDSLAPSKSVHVQGNLKLNGQRNRYIPSIDKATNSLGLRLNISLAESLKKIGNSSFNKT